uniref:Uncharacterized protein n=1 Tax=Gallus gallus TaxID=9031 RepID=A0A8V0XLG9_CHICK
MNRDKKEMKVCPVHRVALFSTHLFSLCVHIIINTEVVCTFPGTNVTLQRTFPKPQCINRVQAQWSKINSNELSRISVHHPKFGTRYFEFFETHYNYSSSECSRWALHL